MSVGWMRTRPSRTASPATLASGPTLTNHCSDSRGSTTVPHRMHVRADLRDDAALLAQGRHDRWPRLEPVQALERALGGDDATLVQDGAAGQAVPAADLEVVRVVCRGHLDRLGAELRVAVRISHHRDAAARQRPV